MKIRLVLLTSYFIFTYIFLVGLIFNFAFYRNNSDTKVLGIRTQNTNTQPIEQTSVAINPHEARVEVLREFFDRYGSPLSEYSDLLVETADKNGLDYRLLPAIAMQESTLCLKAPKGTNNCWGFGIYGKKKTSFDNYAQAIETIGKTLAENYHGKGLVEPEQIMTKYTPSNDGTWAENVSYVMERIALSL